MITRQEATKRQYKAPETEWEAICQDKVLCDSISDASLEDYTFDPIV